MSLLRHHQAYGELDEAALSSYDYDYDVVSVQDTGVCLPELHTVSYRRDVVFSQAVSTIITGNFVRHSVFL